MIENNLCSYGCGRIAKIQFKNGKYCCENISQKCPINIKKRSDQTKKFWKDSENKKKMSNSQKKRYENPENRKAHSKTMLNIFKENPEIRKNYSEAMKKRWSNKENIEEQSKTMKKYFKDNPDTLKIMSKGLKKHYKDDPNAVKKRTGNPKTRKKISKSVKKYFKDNPEARKKLSETQKKRLRNNPHKHPTYICTQKGFISSIEKKVKLYLDEENIQYKHNYPQLGFFIDFAILNKKIAIECDGDYWHNLPGSKERDYKRQKELEKKGWEFIRFTESEINNDFNNVSNIITSKL